MFPNSFIGGFARYTDAGSGTPGEVVSRTFVLDGTTFIGINGGPEFPFSAAVSFVIDCADYYWNRLVAGGEGSQCLGLKDRFGLSWQVVPRRLHELLDDSDPARATAATKAMLGMCKMVIAQLEAAAEQALALVSPPWPTDLSSSGTAADYHPANGTYVRPDRRVWGEASWPVMSKRSRYGRRCCDHRRAGE